MELSRTTDGWDSGEAYEEFMGRWSRLLAAEFIDWLDAEPASHWLDVGTGTGALATAICSKAQPASIVACDPSAPFVEAARQGLADPRVTFEIAGVENLPRREGGYDVVVSGLALNFFPDTALAIEEQLSAVRVGGLVGAYVWDYADGMEFLKIFWEAAAAIDPNAAEMDEGHRFPMCNPKSLESLFSSAGVEQVRVEQVGVPTTFSSFEDYWHPFLGGPGPAPSFVSALSEENLLALENDLRHRLPTEGSGRIDLEARAWAVVGRRV